MIQDILALLSERYPFPYSELHSFYEEHKSIDLLIIALDFSASHGLGDLRR